SGSSNGGLISFGAYLIQVVDARGILVGAGSGTPATAVPGLHGLRQPISVQLHYTAREAAAGIAHARATINGALPRGTVGAAPTAPVGPGGTDATGGVLSPTP